MNHPTLRTLVLTTLSCITCGLLFASCASIPAASRVDFSHYNKPLTEQVTDQIKTKVLARLGKGKNVQDRYFIIPFAYENKDHDPAFSHSFISVIKVFADGSHPTLNDGLRKRVSDGHEFEAFTISWLPHDFPENPHLRIFEGPGAMMFPSLNRCPATPGKSFDLPTTLGLAVGAKVAVGMWGPYEISKPGFDLGIKRLRLLETGTIKYRADDRGYRKRKEAINCFHAMASLDELFPNGGFLDTGLMMWGLNGTKQVLREYTTRATNKQLLKEKVDIEKDVFGFVYAPNRTDKKIYNPFATSASAYHK